MEPELLSYVPTNTTYALSVCNHPSVPVSVAIASFIETQHNAIQVLTCSNDTLNLTCEVEHTYPPTKLMWSPDTSGSTPPLLASSGDSLRIWDYTSDLSLKSRLLVEDKKDSPPPLTSLDWNSTNFNLIGTSSIDTTCTIWDLEKETARAQLIAHDKEVYDIAFAKGVNVFSTAGGDGSVRQFDLRDLQDSAILYERQDFTPCLRLAWSKHDPNYLATIIMDTASVIIIDLRQLSSPVVQLLGHNQYVNAMAWSPSSGRHILTGGDDHQALIWEVDQAPSVSPSLVYTSDSEINNVSWSALHPDIVSFASNNEIKVLKV